MWSKRRCAVLLFCFALGCDADISIPDLGDELEDPNDDDGDNDENGDGDRDTGDGDTGDGDNGDGDVGGDGDLGDGDTGDGDTGDGDTGDGDTGDGDVPGDGDTGDGDVPGDGDTGDGDVPGDGDTGDGDVPGDGDTGDGDVPGDGDTGDGDVPGDGDTGDGDTGDGDSGQYRQARLTHYYSYPDPNSPECWEFSGCEYVGYFSAWPTEQKSEEWVSQHNLVAVHERDYYDLVFKTLRIKSGDHEIEAMVVDMCKDSDCDGCCTANAAETGFLLDLESYTAERFGIWDSYSVDWMCIDC